MSSALSRLKREGGISLVTPQGKRGLSRVEGRIFWLFSRCCSKLGFPLKLLHGLQETTLEASGKFSLHAICEGPLGIPLQSLLGPRSSSVRDSRTSGFLCCAGMDLGFPPEFPQGSQSSSRVETCKSTLLSSWKSSVRLPVGLI